MVVLYERGYYYPASLSVWLVNLVIGFIEAAFALRIILLLLAANPSSPFVAWVYDTTQRLLGPFAGALPVFSIGRGAVIELSVILAMIAYSVLGWLIIRLLDIIFFSPRFLGGRAEHPTMPLRG